MSELLILLVHGELHGAWCWRDVLPELRKLGLNAKAIDLPGHGADPTPIPKIDFESYARAVLDSLAERTLLVGHGMGGFAISAAAEVAPERTAGLVYLSAFIPRNGLSIAELRAQAAEDPLDGKTMAADDGHSFTISPPAVEDLLYHDCPPGVLTYAAARINREPVRPLQTPLPQLKRTPKLPRFAIIAEQDKLIPPALQTEMACDIPKENQFRIDASHAPFFSDPSGLAVNIARIAAQV